MPEIKTKYQWIKGDEQGTLDIFLKEEDGFLTFESGRRCNKELVDEFLIPIYFDEDILSFTDVQDTSIIKASKAKSKYNKAIEGLAVDGDGSTPKDIPTIKNVIVSPLIPLLEKSKKKSIKLNTIIDMSLPSKEVLNVLSDSFDDDVIDVLSKYIVSQTKDPKSFLEKRVKSSIKDWFGKKS